MSLTLKVDASEFIEHTCEFANDIMQRQLGENYSDSIYEDEHNCIHYTEEGQNLFEELLGEVEWFLNKFGVVNGSANEKTLSRSSLEYIRSLGYTINVVPFMMGVSHEPK